MEVCTTATATTTGMSTAINAAGTWVIESLRPRQPQQFTMLSLIVHIAIMIVAVILHIILTSCSIICILLHLLPSSSASSSSPLASSTSSPSPMSATSALPISFTLAPILIFSCFLLPWSQKTTPAQQGQQGNFTTVKLKNHHCETSKSIFEPMNSQSSGPPCAPTRSGSKSIAKFDGP